MLTASTPRVSFYTRGEKVDVAKVEASLTRIEGELGTTPDRPRVVLPLLVGPGSGGGNGPLRGGRDLRRRGPQHERLPRSRAGPPRRGPDGQPGPVLPGGPGRGPGRRVARPAQGREKGARGRPAGRRAGSPGSTARTRTPPTRWRARSSGTSSTPTAWRRCARCSARRAPRPTLPVRSRRLSARASTRPSPPGARTSGVEPQAASFDFPPESSHVRNGHARPQADRAAAGRRGGRPRPPLRAARVGTVTHPDWAGMLVRALELEGGLPETPTPAQALLRAVLEGQPRLRRGQRISARPASPCRPAAARRWRWPRKRRARSSIRLTVITGGDYRVRARLAGAPDRPAAVEFVPAGQTAPAARSRCRRRRSWAGWTAARSISTVARTRRWCGSPRERRWR